MWVFVLYFVSFRIHPTDSQLDIPMDDSKKLLSNSFFFLGLFPDPAPDPV